MKQIRTGYVELNVRMEDIKKALDLMTDSCLEQFPEAGAIIANGDLIAKIQALIEEEAGDLSQPVAIIALFTGAISIIDTFFVAINLDKQADSADPTKPFPAIPPDSSIH